MDDEVAKFEESILFFADAHRLHGPGSKSKHQLGLGSLTPIETPLEVSPNSSCITTPSLTREPSPPASIKSLNDSKRLSFGHRLLKLFNFSVHSADIHIQEFTHNGDTIQDDAFARESDIDYVAKNGLESLEAWQLEAACVDRAVQILPGVKKIIDSIPAGRYAVATSGAKTYGNYLPTSYALINTPDILQSLRLHESCRYHSSSCHYHRRR